MTSRPASAKARAAARPITPAPITTASTSSTRAPSVARSRRDLCQTRRVRARRDRFSIASRRKPGPTLPTRARWIGGSRLSPGRSRKNEARPLRILAKEHRDREILEQLGRADAIAAGEHLAGEDIAPRAGGGEGDVG